MFTVDLTIIISFIWTKIVHQEGDYPETRGPFKPSDTTEDLTES